MFLAVPTMPPRPPIVLLPPLLERGIGLRPQTGADTAFLCGLYASTRQEELAPLSDWTPAMKTAFLEQQFAAQTHHYTTHYAESEFMIIECRDKAIGRLYLDRIHPSETRIVDIAFLPQWCGQGLGGAVIDSIFADARAANRAVSIHVEKFNPAQRLYFRKGFQREDTDAPDHERQVYWLLKWTPEAVAT